MNPHRWIIAVCERPDRADTTAAGVLATWFMDQGIRSETLHGVSAPPPGANAVVIGRPGSHPWLRSMAEDGRISTEGLGEEGFHIRTLGIETRIVAIAGGGRLGVLYGADELRQRAGSLEELEGLDVRDRPRFALRANKMPPPLNDDYIARRRINTVYLPTWLPLGTDFAGVYAGLKVMEEMVGVTPDQWKNLEWYEQRALRGKFDNLARDTPDEIERQIGDYRRRIRELTELGVRVFISRYEWGFPFLTLARNYFEKEIITGGSKESSKSIQICLSSDRTREIIRRTYAKTFELFPELSGAVIYTSAEGGFGVPCSCESCQALFADFERDLPAGFKIGGLRKDRGGADVQFLHKHAFDLVYAAIRAVRKDAEIVRNSWDFQPIKAPLGTDYIHRYTPEDVIFMPYTVSTDTNLREDPNPQITLWTRKGRRVAPKMCQITEMHPRSNCFPNDISDRLQDFYQQWADASVHGTCLHGGIMPGEQFSKYEAMEDNLGFGFNHVAHWKLMWNPFREDLEQIFHQWAGRIYGAAQAEAVVRCLRRAGKLNRFGPQVKVVPNPTYRDYLAYAAKADGAGGNRPIGYMGFLYPFGFDNILLHDKLTHKFFVNPALMHSEFVYNYEDYPQFRANLEEAYRLMDENRADLKAATTTATDPEPIRALASWLEVERDFLTGMAALYEGEEYYLIHGDLDRAASAFSRAHDFLHESLRRWGGIALEQQVWPFSMGGGFYPYRDKAIDKDGAWLQHGAFGTFFGWLAARRDDPGGPDLIKRPEAENWVFHEGLKRFRWPME
jgi:hypothetical protein